MPAFARIRTSRTRFIAGLGTLGLAGMLPSPGRAADVYTLRMSFAEDATSVVGTGLIRYATAVRRRSNRQLNVEVYPSGQLAGQRETIDGLVSGVIDLGFQTSAQLQGLVPRLQALDMPFLFKSGPDAFRLLDGPIGNDFFAETAAKGIIGLGWGVNGFKELQTTTRAVVTPDDMKGLRIRIQGGAVYVALYQALGAIPVTIDISETYTALSQHTIDGADLTLDTVVAKKYYAVVKRVAMMNHVFAVAPLMGSKRKIDALPPALQKIVKDEGKIAAGQIREGIIKQQDENIAILKQNGVAFTNIQYPLFRKAVEPVRAILQARIGGDLLDRIDRALG